MFGPQCLPVNLPANGAKTVTECLLTPDGDSDFSSIADAHTAIVEQVVELDETLTEKYLAGEEPDEQSLHGTFERAMDEGHVVPILFTDAKAGVGVTELLDFISRWFPSPLEGNLRPFVSGEPGN